MRIHQLAFQLVNKHVPIDDITKSDLQTSAGRWYEEQCKALAAFEAKVLEVQQYNTAHAKDEGFKPMALPVKTLKLRIIEYLELWWVRYIIAFLYIWLLPRFDKFIHGEAGEGKEDAPDEDEEDEYEQFMAFRKMKKRF